MFPFLPSRPLYYCYTFNFYIYYELHSTLLFLSKQAILFLRNLNNMRKSIFTHSIAVSQAAQFQIAS